MPLDRARLEYLIEDLKTRPERVVMLKRAGGVGAFVLFALIVFLLAQGRTEKKAKPKIVSDQPKPLTQGMQDAFATAKAAEPILKKDARFSRVYFVPSAATAAQKLGKIVVQGEMNSEEDLQALQREMLNIAVSVPLEWKVSLPAGN